MRLRSFSKSIAPLLLVLNTTAMKNNTLTPSMNATGHRICTFEKLI